MSCFAFFFVSVHRVREAAAARTPRGCDPPIPHDQGRRAHSCMAARGAAPCALQAALALHCLPLRSPAPRTDAVRKMEANARGAPTAASLCALRAAGLPQGPPRGAPGTRRMSRLESRRRDTRASRSLFTSLSNGARPSAPLSWARVSNGDDEPPAVAALLGREGRAPATPSALAASPRRTPHEAANPNSPFGGFTNPQSASALKARPLQGPGLWEVGASFLLCSDARAN